MLSTALVALDSTILATAVPSIVAELSGFTQFPWLFSMYLLTQAVTVPVYSKLADTVGRKPIMLIGIGLFLLGSILCGFSWDMTSLIVFRGVQGLGAGAIQPVSMTIAGDIYTVAERAKAQGYLASVWGISAVVGPALGGVFTQFLSWRWIFFVNIPLCLLAVWMLLRSLHEPGERRQHRIDYAGAVLLTTAASLVVLGLLEGGHAWAWDSPIGIGVFVLAGVLLVAFALVERRAAEPVLPLSVFTSRTIVSATVISLLIGTVIIGITSYGPAYLQDVLGHGPLAAGFAIAALTLGWPLAAAQSGRLYLRFGFRVTALIGSVIAVIGTFWVVLWTPHTSLWQVAAVCFVIGVGMGLINSPTMIGAQASVGWSQRGVVTGVIMFARSIGSAVGVAVFGAMANAVVTVGPDGRPDPAELFTATHRVFIVMLVVVVLLVVGCLALPKRNDQHVVEWETPGQPDSGSVPP